ncbi:dihydroorotase [Polynucleobacter sp. QLW-P1DATA-2]|uniref:dihydroorotase n=1 Tax=unclassified Polynucleobacter TaxID=2640945 RepID=UPI0008F9463F|nr:MULTISPECIES: dihydroorotase [unclassified Polynucleobacter]OIM97592.1 dihydroorotase [Polynucleobacter sp. MWH-Tro8-2-5-gr]OIN03510.1 dihydroorotase [Polynucleobacter sp. QLW-P1DATA-2]
MTNSPTQIQLVQPDDWHLHIRDGEVMKDVLADTARQFARAIIMPNLKPPVTTVDLAKAYQARIESNLKSLSIDSFTPLMTLYLTDNTSADEVHKAKAAGIVGFKLYPAGATTNSDAGVSDIKRCYKALEAMQAVGMPLLVHGEVTHADIDIFDREAVFIDHVLEPLRKDFPELKIVFEHITTKQAAHYVRDAATGGKATIAATITPQHLLMNRNSIFAGGIRPHNYCLPVLKREEHRIALLEAATSGNTRFFLGTDSAPHAKGAKEAACGCAGCYSAFNALGLYAEAFENAGKLDKLEGFASFFGPDFYSLSRNSKKITLVKQAQSIPAELPLGDATIVPLRAGETIAWSLI